MRHAEANLGEIFQYLQSLQICEELCDNVVHHKTGKQFMYHLGDTTLQKKQTGI